MRERATAGGLGYGDAKKELLALVLEHFGPMRERPISGMLKNGYAQRYAEQIFNHPVIIVRCTTGRNQEG